MHHFIQDQVDNSHIQFTCNNKNTVATINNTHRRKWHMQYNGHRQLSVIHAFLQNMRFF